MNAAGEYLHQQEVIKQFWDSHLPVMMSVKSGYAYLALEQETLRVVEGHEPEFEKTSVIAPSMVDFLQLITLPHSSLQMLV